MPYLKITNGHPEIYSIGQLRRDNPNTSFPKLPSNALLAGWKVCPYTVQDRPTVDYMTHTLTATSLADVDGTWVQGWEVSNLPVEDVGRNIRSQRDTLLAETDWRALTDGSMSTAWSTYRQALRDITAQEGFPHSVVWPTEPE